MMNEIKKKYTKNQIVTDLLNPLSKESPELSVIFLQIISTPAHAKYLTMTSEDTKKTVYLYFKACEDDVLELGCRSDDIESLDIDDYIDYAVEIMLEMKVTLEYKHRHH